MGIKSDLDKHESNNERPFFLESAPYTMRCRRIDCSKSKNGDRAVFKFNWTPTEDVMAAFPNAPLDFPTVDDELDGNLPRDWKIIKYLLGNPSKGDKGMPRWSGGLIQWNGALGADQMITGHADVTIKTKEPNPKNQGGGYWPAQYKVEDYDPAGTHELAAAEGLAACLNDEEPSEEKAIEEQAARGPKKTQGKGSGKR